MNFSEIPVSASFDPSHGLGVQVTCAVLGQEFKFTALTRHEGVVESRGEVVGIALHEDVVVLLGLEFTADELAEGSVCDLA